MGDHLGVGIGGKCHAGLLQIPAQLVEILDDAVVDDCEAVGRVRVRVHLVGTAMGCPTRVTDADCA
jgi:hypothetical protein